MEQEIWKDVVGWEGFYQVSNLGRVKSVDRFVKRGEKKMHVKELVLKNTLDSKGYYMVALCDKERGDIQKARVHRLVAEAFIKNPYNKPYIDHINTIKTELYVLYIYILYLCLQCKDTKNNRRTINF